MDNKAETIPWLVAIISFFGITIGWYLSYDDAATGMGVMIVCMTICVLSTISWGVYRLERILKKR